MFHYIYKSWISTSFMILWFYSWVSSSKVETTQFPIRVEQTDKMVLSDNGILCSNEKEIPIAFYNNMNESHKLNIGEKKWIQKKTHCLTPFIKMAMATLRRKMGRGFCFVIEARGKLSLGGRQRQGSAALELARTEHSLFPISCSVTSRR